MFSFSSLFAIGSQLSPEPHSSGIRTMETDTFKLHCHQTMTGMNTKPFLCTCISFLISWLDFSSLFLHHWNLHRKHKPFFVSYFVSLSQEVKHKACSNLQCDAIISVSVCHECGYYRGYCLWANGIRFTLFGITFITCLFSFFWVFFPV